MHNTRSDVILRRITTILSVVIITLTLIGATTGILLSFYYEPAAGRAYQSLKIIDTEVPYGWLFHKAHQIAGNGVVVIALIQIVVMFVSRQFRKSWLTAWISGILFTLSAIGLGWTAMILSWDQEGFWRFSIELGTIEAIPFIGSVLRDILTGGGAISTVTLQHLYTIHSYIVSVAALVLAVVHLLSVLWQEKQIKKMYAEGAIPETGKLQQQLNEG
ncbi:cytochrome b/b6 domain-containing protein [Scytonema sp. HK-05]|uniref:cytochrome b N-terminal domain-containing protein n=1 Tax=Scytonema sp. HK-05 TaxID=1137095 RepID=UPI000936C766|nr:cytochrome b N-terminal domain-containing protein [Scytonema sp. HK-05]OKH57628.1 cytochrome B6 [Scytonema sp. HK-05]BAY44550.1 cytochrome b/b6 domain-containing protein [Scytonema sp. HK-05]